jgi:hypothetical protein
MKFVYDMARIHLIWYMEENLEILGTEKMSFISMVGSSWPLLHSRQAGEQELATPRSLPPYASKKRKQSIISSTHVFSPDNFGFSSYGLLV